MAANGSKSETSVILFDGECGLCHRSVRFVIARDPGRRFRFASLQSEFGRQIAGRFELGAEPLSILLLEGDQLTRESTAALRVARRLRRLWPMLYMFIVVPIPIRNAVYRFIARNRYRWFGRRDVCELPSPSDRDRFVEAATPSATAASAD